MASPTRPAVADQIDVTIGDVQAAAERLAGRVHCTPCWESRTFSELCGGRIWLKYENVQRTGSYKLRGALNRILTLSADTRARGVIAASAGNHGQGVAVAAQLSGVSATIVMPSQAPLAKVAATRGYGARVILHGEVFDEAHAEALRMAAREGLTYIHPFDDPAVMAGQGTVALEVLDAAPAVDTLVVPIGGGGLIAGMSVAARSIRPGVRIIGVQASGANATHLAFHEKYAGPLESPQTIADGLLTRAPGEHTLPLIRRYVDDVVTVTDEAIAETVVLLMERAKTVAEPAGAVALAALLSGAVQAADRVSCAIISGGNVDPNMMDRLLQFGLGASGRHLRLRTKLDDRPGALVRLSTIIADQGANIFEVVHHRIGSSNSVNVVDLELTLEVHDRAHGEALLEALRAASYVTEVVQPFARR
ncbi:MAG: threonine ammonia-lyase [Chloroflexi bacterium]|nr:threonine ammonia-lyase [Chloroflexota bacterium]